MPSTYTTNLRLEKPATGEQAGTWGVTVNKSLDFLDAGVDGNIPIDLSASYYDLFTNQGEESNARNKVLVFQGAGAGPGTVTINISPNTVKKVYFVSNRTSQAAGVLKLIFSQGTGDSFTLEPGYSAVIYAQGTGPASSVKGALADLQVNSLLVLTSLVVRGAVTQQGAVTVQGAATFQSTVSVQGAATFTGAVSVGGLSTLSGGAAITGAVITGPLAIILGSDATGDLYYRSGSAVARLPVGGPGTVLTVSAGGSLTWEAPAAVSIGIGTPLVGAVVGRVLFVDAGLKMAQDSEFIYQAGIGLGIGPGAASGAAFRLDVHGDASCSGTFRRGVLPISQITTYLDNPRPGVLDGGPYRNDYGRPMFIAVTAVIDPLQYMQLLADSSNPPTTIVAARSNGHGVTVTESVNGWVMPGHYFKIKTPGATLTKWLEWM